MCLCLETQQNKKTKTRTTVLFFSKYSYISQIRRFIVLRDLTYNRIQSFVSRKLKFKNTRIQNLSSYRIFNEHYHYNFRYQLISICTLSVLSYFLNILCQQGNAFGIIFVFFVEKNLSARYIDILKF